MKKIKFVIFPLILLPLTACAENVEAPEISETPTEIIQPTTSPEIKKTKAQVLDRIAVQNEMDEVIKIEMVGGYTANSPLVLLDPYDVAPLTALVIFDTEKACTVSIEIKGKTEETTFTHDFSENSTHHEIPVYALYAGSVNEVNLTLNFEDGTVENSVVLIETEALPDYLSPFEVLVKDEKVAGGEQGELLFLASATDTVYPFAIDKNGDVRWYSSTNTFAGGLMRRVENGRFLTLSDPMYAPAFIRSGFLETDLLGKIYSEYLVDYTHHDVIKLQNGNYMVNTIKPDSTIAWGPIVVGSDAILEISSETGETVRSWDLNAICGYTAEDVAEGRYMHTNAVFYDENDNSIIISAPNPMLIVKIDAETSEIIWAIGNPLNNYPEPVQSKILTPTDSEFLWNGMIHAPTVLPNGNIMLFDNGTGRLDQNGNIFPDEESFSRLVIFDVDEENMTISTVFEYGEERGNDMYAGYLGDVDYLGENHYLINAGGRIIAPETGLSKGTAFDVYMGISRGEASVVELKDGEVVFEVYVGEDADRSFHNIYRAEWLGVYGENESEYNLNETSGIRYGELLPSETANFEIPPETEVLKLENEVFINPIDYGYQLNVPLYVDGLEQGDSLYLELINGDISLYFDTNGLDGAEGVVRASSLENGVYDINLVLHKTDGQIFRHESGFVWEIV